MFETGGELLSLYRVQTDVRPLTAPKLPWVFLLKSPKRSANVAFVEVLVDVSLSSRARVTKI